MKQIKMVLYGEPGTGKSVFACRFPKPFFVTTDGNYEWLEDFGADPNAYSRVSTWSEAKSIFSKLDKPEYEQYQTIVVDLVEDLFKFCEKEFCEKNRLDHVSDIGYGKGYDITRNDFFLEMCKLINLDKHIVFLSHGITTIVKDRRGVEHTKYVPSSRIPDKVWDMIEGRVRYFLRCYTKAEENENGGLTKHRYLSLVPKENEFAILRGMNENNLPSDINLDFNCFVSALGLDTARTKSVKVEDKVEEIIEPTEEVKPKRGRKPKEEKQITIEESIEEAESKVVEEPKIEVVEVKEEVKPQPVKTSEPSAVNSTTTTVNSIDKIAAIKAKLAAMKAQQ